MSSHTTRQQRKTPVKTPLIGQNSWKCIFYSLFAPCHPIYHVLVTEFWTFFEKYPFTTTYQLFRQPDLKKAFSLLHSWVHFAALLFLLKSLKKFSGLVTCSRLIFTTTCQSLRQPKLQKAFPLLHFYRHLAALLTNFSTDEKKIGLRVLKFITQDEFYCTKIIEHNETRAPISTRHGKA